MNKENVVSDSSAIEDSAFGDQELSAQSVEDFHDINTESSVIYIEQQESRSSMAESKTYQLHRFNGQNYQLWKLQMEIFMAENKLKPYILGTTPRPIANPEEWDNKDAEAKAFIMRGLELEQLKYLINCSTAAEMWRRLKTVHAERSEQSAQILLEKFINCKIDEEENMADYVARVTSLAQRLKDMDMEQKEPMVIAKILSSLPSKFDHVRTAWYAVPRVEQTIDRLTDHLVNEESLINLRAKTDDTAQGEAFAVSSYNKRSDKTQNNARPNRKGKCNYCHKEGHWARECHKRERDRKSKQRDHHRQKNAGHSFMLQRESDVNIRDYSNHLEEDAQLFTLQSTNTNDKIKNIWFADSGATDHMSFQKELFKNFVPFSSNVCQVRVGDGRKLPVIGKGDIEVQVTNRRSHSPVHIIQDVLYVPDLGRNFISVSRSTEKGMKVIFEEGAQKVRFLKGSVVIADGVRNNRLYRMNLESIRSSELNVVSSTSLMLWHERLGHVNFKTLREMRSKQAVDKLELNEIPGENPFCEGCSYGKQHRLSFPKSGARRATTPGETFHVDLCGKMSTSSIGGANYFMLLKDDFSRYCFVYFLKTKTEVLANLVKFYADVRADGHDIKILRSDGGLEFCNEHVDQFLLSKGIKHQVSTPRSPEQNGMIERQNRTIVECAKAMLHGRKLPLYLWAEATNTAVYLKNRTMSETIGGATPYEKWFGSKPSVDHLRVFGCDVYVHIPKSQRTKWEKNSVKCQMIGYHDESKAYRIYEPTGRKILIRRDVVFNEDRDSVHTITEVKKNDIRQPEELQVLSGDEEDKQKKKHPRLPIPRSPYNTRSKSTRLTDGEGEEEITMAEICMVQTEPTCLEDALENDESKEWLAAIYEEINSLKKNNTWVLVPRTKNMNVITNRWVFKKKYRADGRIDKYKARLVAKGYLQKFGIDYEETFSPVVRHDSVRILLSIAAANNLILIQFDVKTAFLHGELEEEIFMEQPYGFSEDDRVCLLKKSLYGLKQASRQWNKKIVKYLVNYGFQQSKSDTCIFVLKSNESVLYLALYVDDGLLCGNNRSLIQKLLEELHLEFEITSRDAEFFVGLQIKRDEEKMKLIIHQSVYTRKVLERFNHSECSPVSVPAEPGIKFSKLEHSSKNAGPFPYREAIGSLMYLMICTRPDISFIVGVLSRYLECPTSMHWEGVKRILKYLRGSAERGVAYDLGSNEANLIVYCDADWAGDLDTRRSTSGWIALLNGGPIAWNSKRQRIVTTSTTEAEFVALCAATKAVIPIRRLLSDLNEKQGHATPIKCDNQRAITLVNNPESSKRTKHIDTQYFFTCDMRELKEIEVEYVSTKKQLADPLTKALPRDTFKSLIDQYGLCNV